MIRLEIIGTLGADAVFKQIENNCYISLRAAHNDKTRNEKGDTVINTTWVQILYKSSNQKLVDMMKKGTRIYARGHFSAHIYDSAKLHCKSIAYNMYATELEICSMIKDNSNNI